MNTKKNSKRILSLLLSIMMVLAMVPMQTVFVADAAVDTSCVGGCNGDHTGYTAITAETWGYTIKKPGNYYLTSNYQCGNSFNITISGRVGNVTICLNGYTLSNTKNYSRIIYVGDGNTVNLCDCKGTGTLEYNNTKANDLVFVGSNSTFNMYGGTLRCATEGVSTYLTTGYYNSWSGGTFNMYGGTISTNSYAVDNSGRFNYYGGTITSTKAEGAVNNDPYTEKGYMTVNGSATFSVYLAKNTQIDTSKMTGGKITVNSESDSDNIAVTGSNNSDVTSRFVSGKDDYIIINGDNNVVMLHKHQWQAATCKTLKYCDYCGQYSGELDPNNHDSEETYFKFADNENHNVYYSCCDALKETIPHNADIEANCGDVAYCGDCESSFGDVNPDNHTSEDTYTQLIDDDVHGIYHSCCSALKSTEVHTPVDLATCTNQSSCSVCLSTYGETNGENHTGELIWYTTDYSHIKKWTCCGATEGVAETHTPVFAVSEDGTTISATCSVCEKDLGSYTIKFADDGIVYDGKVHKAEMDGCIYCAYGDNALYITYWQNGEQLNTAKKGGISGAGDYTVRLGLKDNSLYIEKDVTINKRELTVDAIYVDDREYNGTNKVNAYAASYNNVVEGEVLYSGIAGTLVVSDSKAGYYETVKGVEKIDVFASTIASYYGDNYYVTVDPETEYPIAGGGCYIDQRQITVTAENQSITEGDAIDQKKYILENLLEGYECSGIALETNDYDNVISVNTDNAVVTYDGEDLTENFWFSTYSGILETVCQGHEFNKDGFCSTGECGVYQTPEYTVNEYGEKTYVITNAGELYFYAQQVNVYWQNSISAKLANDIEIPLTVSQGGTIPDWTPINDLYAEFDGQGHTISGLYCKSDASYVGMFGYTGYYPIKNLIISDSYFEGPSTVGAIAGYSQAEISNCGVTDTVVIVSDGYSVGGFVGNNASSIKNSFAMTSTFVGYSSESYGASTENCYYIAEEADDYDGTTAVSADAFASGEVAYLLQAGVQPEDIYDDDWNYIETIIPEIWGQKIGTDNYPVVGGDKVYQVENCKGETVYSNTNENKDHNFENGICTECGEKMELGDVDGDGNVTINDATELQKFIAYISTFTEAQKLAADVNSDGKTSIRDVTYIQMYVVKIIEEFPVNQ